MTSDSIITLIVEQPGCKVMQCMTMNTQQWESRRMEKFFPLDNNRLQCSLHFKSPGHFIFSHNERERVVFEGFNMAEVDLGELNPAWEGCIATLINAEHADVA